MKRILQSFRPLPLVARAGIFVIVLVVFVGLSCGVFRKDQREVVRIYDGEVVVIDTVSFDLDLLVVRSEDMILKAVVSQKEDCDKRLSKCDSHSRIKLHEHYSLTLKQWQAGLAVESYHGERVYGDHEYEIPRAHSGVVDTFVVMRDLCPQHTLYEAREIVCMEYCSPETKDEH